MFFECGAAAVSLVKVELAARLPLGVEHSMHHVHERAGLLRLCLSLDGADELECARNLAGAHRERRDGRDDHFLVHRALALWVDCTVCAIPADASSGCAARRKSHIENAGPARLAAVEVPDSC